MKLSSACATSTVMLTGAATANEIEFSYPHANPATAIELFNTKTADLALPILNATPDNIGTESEDYNFSIPTESARRALFKPGQYTPLQSNDPALAAAHSSQSTQIHNADKLWINGNRLSNQGRDLVQYVRELYQHGLVPNRYNSNTLQSWLDSEITDDQLAHVSTTLQNTFYKVANAIGSGIVDPTDSQKEWDREADSINADTLLEQIDRGVMDIKAALHSIEPQDTRYQGLKKMLLALEALDQSEQVFVEAAKKLESGMDNESVLQLKRALIANGDLKPNTNDSSVISSVYDSDLESAVKRFQLRHGLQPDGIAGPKTLEHLNTPIGDRIAQVKANLERWRWFPSRLEDSHIIINIPEYRVRMMHDNSEIFEMDVVVGKPKHMTPVFSETMKQVVFAPTWTVPASITNDELIPIEKRSPGYLEREEIDFYRHTSSGLQYVPRSEIGRETLDQKPFPYMLRQRAGSKNVLGKVKFMFPNKHAVYMHDTQAKKLFDESQRAFSHGCIRLSNPDLMAYVIMQLDGYRQNEVNDYMALTKTTNVNLNTHIPVHIAYFTAWQDEHGLMHFRDDIYKQDQRLIAALDAKQGNIDRLAAIGP